MRANGGTDLWTLVLPRWGKYTHTHKPFMGEICNYMFITDYAMFIQQKSAFIVLLPRWSLHSFISKNKRKSYQFVSFNLHSSHLDKNHKSLLQKPVTGPKCTLYTPHSCSVYSGEGPVTLTPVTLHYITFHLAHLSQRLIG